MYGASLVLLGAAAITLVLGLRGDGVTVMFVSAALSVAAAVAVIVAVLRRLRRPSAS